MVAFDDEMYKELTFQQPPWSMNAIGRAYLLHAFNTPEYAQRTWTHTAPWRANMISRLARLYPHWKFHGEDWVSWIWIDTTSEYEAASIVAFARKAGFPIRHGKQGYNMNSFIRIAVRDPELVGNMGGLLDGTAIQSPPPQFINLNEMKQKLILGEKHVPNTQIRIHEKYIADRADCLHEYISKTNFSISIPSIIVSELAGEEDVYVIIDGHHRFEVMKRLGYESIPITVVDYFHPDIMINPPRILLKNAASANGSCDLFDSSTVNTLNLYEKNKLIKTVCEDAVMDPKTTEHVIRISNTFTPISNIANMMAKY